MVEWIIMHARWYKIDICVSTFTLIPNISVSVLLSYFDTSWYKNYGYRIQYDTIGLWDTYYNPMLWDTICSSDFFLSLPLLHIPWCTIILHVDTCSAQILSTSLRALWSLAIYHFVSGILGGALWFFTYNLLEIRIIHHK